MKKLHTKQQLFFGVFKTFEEYENYMERIEEPTLDFVDTMVFLSKENLNNLCQLATNRKN